MSFEDIFQLWPSVNNFRKLFMTCGHVVVAVVVADVVVVVVEKVGVAGHQPLWIGSNRSYFQLIVVVVLVLLLLLLLFSYHKGRAGSGSSCEVNNV